MLPTNPPKNINLVHPISQHIKHNIRIIVHNNTLMESIIPKERSRENQPTWSKRIWIILFVNSEGILCIESTIIESHASVQIWDHVLDKGYFLWLLLFYILAELLREEFAPLFEELMIEDVFIILCRVCEINSFFLAFFDCAIDIQYNIGSILPFVLF